MNNDGFEKLYEGIFVKVGDVHRFGTDAFLLADFSNAKQSDTVCDLGTGCGIIPLLLAKKSIVAGRGQPKAIYGVDIQEDAINQFKEGIERSGLNGRLIPICGDIKDRSVGLPYGSFDLVTCNPPYKIGGSGILSEVSGEQIARHEVLCNIDDVCAASSKLLRYGGRLCLCQRPERLCDVIGAMQRNRLEPKTLRFVSKDPSGAPWLFLIEGKKSAKPFLRVLPSLYVYEGDEYTEEMQRIYHMGGL